MTKTIRETKYYDLYQDKNGKFWLWNKKSETNAAIKASTELEAYQEAVDSLIFSGVMYREDRDKYLNKLEDIHRCFDKNFPENNPY